MISRKYDGSAQHDEGDQQDQGRRNMAGGREHGRGKPCHYYIRNVYRFALGCIFHELTNIITVLLLLAATCLPRSIVVTGLAPVMFARPHHAHLPPSCPTPLSCFVLLLSCPHPYHASPCPCHTATRPCPASRCPIKPLLLTPFNIPNYIPLYRLLPVISSTTPYTSPFTLPSCLAPSSHHRFPESTARQNVYPHT